MSHHFFIVTQVETLLYSLAYQSSKPQQIPPHPLGTTSIEQGWPKSTFASTFNALAGGPSTDPAPTTETGSASVKEEDKRAALAIAHSSLDTIEEVMRNDSSMYVDFFV